MKKIIIIGLLLLILSIGAVSAAENATANDAGQDSIAQADDKEILSEGKQDMNISIGCPKYLIKSDRTDYEAIPYIRNMPIDYYQKISMYVDGKLTYQYRQPESLDINLRSLALDYGKHTLLFVFPESERYNAINITHTLEVTEGYIDIPSVVKDSESVSLVLKEGATGYLTVKVDGKEFKKVEVTAESYSTSFAYVSLGSLSKGTHEVVAIYSGDKNTKKLYKKATVSVEPEISMSLYYGAPNTFIDGEYTNTYGSPHHILVVYISEKRTKDIVAYVDGKKFSNVKYAGDDTYQVNLSSLSIGNHTVKVTYPGDSRFSSKTIMENVTVLPRIGLYGSYSLISEYDATDAFLKLPEGAKGNLTVYVDDEFYGTEAITDGIAKIHLDLNVGYHKIAASYDGNDYDIENITKTIEIIPKISYPKRITEGEDKYLTFEMESNYNGTVKIYNQGWNTVPITNGKATFSLKKLKYEDEIGTTISIAFEKENYTFKEMYDIPIELPVNFIAEDVTMYYGDAKTFSVKVIDTNGNTAKYKNVQIKIGTKTNTVQTDKKGFAKINLENTPGTYAITVSYKGYKATYKLVVKHLITLKAATVKKSAKSLTLQSTLKNTKAISGKQITFKFKTKIYKAKTNKNGIAKVTVPKSVLKTLKVGEKVTYQAIYLKDIVKKTAVVKK